MVKVAEGNQNYFGIQDHGSEVIITGGVVEESSKGSQYVQLAFEADGKEGDTGYNNYITEKALPYTAARFQAIAVHNKETEDEKREVCEAFAKVDDDAFGEWVIAGLTGKKAYLVISFSDSINPKNGKPYLERNLQGFPPQPLATPEESAATYKTVGGSTVVDEKTKSEIPF